MLVTETRIQVHCYHHIHSPGKKMVVYGLCKVQESPKRRDRDILVRPVPML